MPIQTSFNAGEFSPLMGGDVDYQKHAYSAEKLQNVICLKQGPFVTRGPTVYVDEVKDSEKRTYLRRFQFSDLSSYLLEFGDQYIRVYKNRARLAVEIAAPYVQADLFDSHGLFKIQFSQSADVLYLVHPDYAPRSLVRVSDLSWTLTELSLDDGPYLEINPTSTTLSLSGTSGSVTVTASSATGINNNTGFQTTDVGRLIRWKDPAGNWTWLEITARASSTSVTATIMGANASAGTATVNWRLGVYGETNGYPSAVGFFQGRICFANVSRYPDRYDLSKVDGYSDTTVSFQPSNAAGTVADDNAIAGYVPSGEVNKIQHVSADIRGFIIATNKEEFLLRASSLSEALTPTNAKVDPLSAVGSAAIQPIRTTNGTTFVQESRRRVFDLVYSIQQDTLAPMELTLAAEHITKGRIIANEYQKEPINVAWYVLETGGLIGITHYPSQEVYGWHRHIIGGYSDSLKTESAIVESIAVIPEPDGERDELWLIVKRNINGQTKRYVEYMRRYYEDDIAQQDYARVDCQYVYDGVATNTVTGLSHLEGETVRVMVDGRSHPDLVVTSGQVVLENNRTGSKIILGLSNQWIFTSRDVEQKFKDLDTSQGKMKSISNVVVRVLNTLGLFYGGKNASDYEYDFDQGVYMDQTTPLYSGDTETLVWPEGVKANAHIELSGDSVFPACVVAIMYDLKANK